MKIRTKILTGYLLLAIPLMGVGLAGYKLTRNIGAAFSSMADKTITDIELLDELRFAAMWIVSSTTEAAWLMDRKNSERRSIVEEKRFLGEGIDHLRKTIGKIKDEVARGEKFHDYEKVLPASEELLAISQRMVANADAGGNSEELYEIEEEFEEAERKFLTIVDHARMEQRDDFVSARRDVDSSISRAFTVILGLDLLLILGAVIAGRTLAGSIARPILRLREAAEKMAAGQTGVDVQRESKDEVGDLTESFVAMAGARERAEEKLARHAAALAEQNEELKSFAYITSHDLREPLVTIRGFSGELKRTLQDVDRNLAELLPHLDNHRGALVAEAFQYDVPEAFGFIDSSIDQMESRIYAIQKLSQLGHLEMVPKPLDIEELVETLLRSMTEQIETAGAIIETGRLPEVTADRAAMIQVVGHLLENALKYHEPSRTPHIGIAAERSEREIIFHIRDNGRGIPAEDLGKIFNMFRTSGAGGKQKTGMGLAYVKSLVRRMGGRIWCDSTVGEGSVFSFTIPAADR